MEFTSSNSPFIRLPPPHQNITLTPPLHTDGSVQIATFNDPTVYMNIFSPPYPYTQADWDARFSALQCRTSAALTEFLEAREHGRKSVGSLPVSSIREVGEDGIERYLGEVAVGRRRFVAVKDKEEQERRATANAAYEVGDERIEWEIGYHISPSARGRGIVPAVVNAVIDSFLVPWMNVHYLIAEYFDGNLASRRVLEKSGFVFVGRTPDAVEYPESKAGVKGKMTGVNLMKWEGPIREKQ